MKLPNAKTENQLENTIVHLADLECEVIQRMNRNFKGRQRRQRLKAELAKHMDEYGIMDERGEELERKLSGFVRRVET